MYKHTRQTKCKPAQLNTNQKSFYTPRSHNRDIMLGHRKSWQNSVGSYEQLAFEKLGWLGEPEVRGLYICLGMPAVSTVDTQGGGLNWFQFPVGSFPPSHTHSPSLCHIRTHALFWKINSKETWSKHTLTNRDGYNIFYSLPQAQDES